MIISESKIWLGHAANFAWIMMLFNVINLGMVWTVCYGLDTEQCAERGIGHAHTVMRNVDYAWGLIVGFIYAWLHHCDVHEKC
jgi:hypothetical protein